MKSVRKWICFILFLLLCGVTVWFLRLFTVTDTSMQYIDWESTVRIESDGTETPFSFDYYSNTTDLQGTFRFTGTLPENRSEGYLLFEIGGAELSLALNGKTIYQSHTAVPNEIASLSSQSTITLPSHVSGELVMTCRITDAEHIIFPPLLRFMPSTLYSAETFAIANRTAFPAGATALAFLLTAGLFLLGALLREPDWSLIPLLLSGAVLTVYRIAQTEGYYFLPETVNHVLTRPLISWLPVLLLLIYLGMNRRRRFFRYLGICTFWSAVLLLFFYLISLAFSGQLDDYIVSPILDLIQYGYYDGIVYWLSTWLTIVSVLISAYAISRSFMEQHVLTQGLELKYKLLEDNYQALEQYIRSTSDLQHEIRHYLTALDLLCQQENYQEAQELIHQLMDTQAVRPQIVFTKNKVINTILQSASGRASLHGIEFNVQAFVPENLNIPPQDLCVFLINMLDNALEACTAPDFSEKPFIQCSIKTVQGFLAIRCENSYSGKIRKNEKGEFLTTKENTAAHGFGLKQMDAIARKYHSMLNVNYTEDGLFILQTALLIPDE